jgi:hypothetical protein
LFWTIELALFALVHLMMSKFSGGADLSTMVLVFVAPIITYGHMKVQNGYSARQIRVNSVLKGLLGTTSMDAILDTGASAHVTNTMSYMSNATADNSFSLVGVNGADSQMTCSYAGYLNIYLSAKTFNGRSIVVNINGEQNDGSRRNAHLAPSSPVTLVSWDQLLERGWRMAEDSSYIFHRSIEAKVYLTRRNGLFYLPICGHSRGGSCGLGVEILVYVELSSDVTRECLHVRGHTRTLPGSYYFYFGDKPARSSARC